MSLRPGPMWIGPNRYLSVSACAGRREQRQKNRQARARRPIGHAVARWQPSAAGRTFRSARGSPRRSTAPPRRTGRRRWGRRRRRGRSAACARDGGARVRVAEQHRDAGPRRRRRRPSRRRWRSRRAPARRSASNATTPTPVSSTATVSASSISPRGCRPPSIIRRSATASTGVRYDVGVEADVAEEHAVGVRDLAAAQRDRLRAAHAVGQRRAGASRSSGGVGPRRRRDLGPRQPQPRVLGGELGGDQPAPDDRLVAHPSSRIAASSCSSSWLPSSVRRTLPPRCGERDRRADRDAVEVGDRAVAVVADRQLPAALADPAAQLRRGRRGSRPRRTARPGSARAGGRARRSGRRSARTARRRSRARPGRARPARRR